jgi:hypothetical protein
MIKGPWITRPVQNGASSFADSPTSSSCSPAPSASSLSPHHSRRVPSRVSPPSTKPPTPSSLCRHLPHLLFQLRHLPLCLTTHGKHPPALNRRLQSPLFPHSRVVVFLFSDRALPSRSGVPHANLNSASSPCRSQCSMPCTPPLHSCLLTQNKYLRELNRRLQSPCYLHSLVVNPLISPSSFAIRSPSLYAFVVNSLISCSSFASRSLHFSAASSSLFPSTS